MFSILEMLKRTKPHRDALNLELTSGLSKGEPQIAQKKSLNIQASTPHFEEMRSSGKNILLVRTGSPRVAVDQRSGRQYRVKRGTRLIGRLSVNFRIKYSKDSGLVTAVRDIETVNTLKINGTTLPLQSDDQVERAFSEEEYMRSRFLGRSMF